MFPCFAKTLRLNPILILPCGHFSGLDNDVGGPAAVTPPKEGKQKNASKKEV